MKDFSILFLRLMLPRTVMWLEETFQLFVGSTELESVCWCRGRTFLRSDTSELSRWVFCKVHQNGNPSPPTSPMVPGIHGTRFSGHLSNDLEIVHYVCRVTFQVNGRYMHYCGPWFPFFLVAMSRSYSSAEYQFSQHTSVQWWPRRHTHRLTDIKLHRSKTTFKSVPNCPHCAQCTYSSF